MTTRPTCQICEGGFTANKQVEGKRILSHHGFQRPGDGWLHGACYGAKGKPYEDSNDLIAPYIEMVQNYKSNRINFITGYKSNPPESITIPSLSRNTEPKVYPRPEGFEPAAAHYGNRYNSYEGAFDSTIREAEYAVVKADREIARMQKRLTDWVVPN